MTALRYDFCANSVIYFLSETGIIFTRNSSDMEDLSFIISIARFDIDQIFLLSCLFPSSVVLKWNVLSVLL